MPASFERFYQASLRNNCPQCFSTDGLQLEFHQQWVENVWVRYTSRTVKEFLHCDHCQSAIYPVHWTQDIERVYQYHLKLAQKPSQFRVKPLTWTIIVALAILLFCLGYLAFA